jgi:calcineurin-like phosphoesterase family protein
MTVFFTSDTHFGDHRAINLYKRPFASTAEMDGVLLRNWNAVVGQADELWHLGDFARTAQRAAELLPELAGRKHLVYGNNDPPAVLDLPGWASVQPYAELEIGEVFLVLCHYPFRSWNRMNKGAFNLHGHSHGRLKALPRQIDVGVEAWGFRPRGLTDLLADR